jgi:hypothetical protein
VRKSRFAAPLEHALAKYSFDVPPLSEVLAFRYHGAVYCDDIVFTRGRDYSCAHFITLAARKFELIVEPKADASRRPCGGKTNVESGYPYTHCTPQSGLASRGGNCITSASKAVRFRPSKRFPVCASKQTQGVYELLALGGAAMAGLMGTSARRRQKPGCKALGASEFSHPIIKHEVVPKCGSYEVRFEKAKLFLVANHWREITRAFA